MLKRTSPKSVGVSSEFLEFVISGQDVSLVNGLRRSLLNDVRTLAFVPDHFVIVENSSYLHRLIVAERIGLIPIFANDPETSTLTQVNFQIDVTNDTTENLQVTTNDIVPSDELPEDVSPDEVAAAFPTQLLITVLRPGESLIVTGLHPELGTGSQHDRWVSAIASYHPVWLAPIVDPIADRRKYAKDAFGSPLEIQMFVESRGHMEPKAALAFAASRLRLRVQNFLDELDMLRKKISDRKENLVQGNNMYLTFTGIANLIEIKVDHESHTLGNLLTSYGIRALHRCLNNRPELSSDCLVSYRKPHPLTDHIVFRVNVSNEVDLTALGEDPQMGSPSLWLIYAVARDLLNFFDDELSPAIEAL
ncbi:MAG: hypothetical protein ACYCOU_00835 [Sulfobacillus sp.]